MEVIYSLPTHPARLVLAENFHDSHFFVDFSNTCKLTGHPLRSSAPRKITRNISSENSPLNLKKRTFRHFRSIESTADFQAHGRDTNRKSREFRFAM